MAHSGPAAVPAAPQGPAVHAAMGGIDVNMIGDEPL